MVQLILLITKLRCVVRELTTILLMSGLVGLQTRPIRTSNGFEFWTAIVLTSYFSSKLFFVSSKSINFWFSAQVSSWSFFKYISILHVFLMSSCFSTDVVQCILEFWWYVISSECNTWRLSSVRNLIYLIGSDLYFYRHFRYQFVSLIFKSLICILKKSSTVLFVFWKNRLCFRVRVVELTSACCNCVLRDFLLKYW